MYQQHKLNFFEQISYAVGRPMQYYRLTKVNSSRLTGFVFLFILVISLFSTFHMVYDIFGPNGINQYLQDEIPQFDLTDGNLYVSERIEDENGYSYILIDTDVYSFSTDDIDKSYGQVFLISQTNIISYQSYRTQEINFSDFGGFHLDNSIIDSLKPLFYLILVIVAIIVYIVSVGWYFFSALLYSLIGLIVNSASHANLTYQTVYKTAIYSKVPIYILFAILGLTPLAVPGLVRFGMSIFVTSLFVIFGILSHTSREAYEEAGMGVPPTNYYH